MHGKRSLTTVYPTLLMVIAIVFTVEAVVMFLLPVLAPDVDGLHEALLDASLLTLLASPLLWFALVNPLHNKVLRGNARAAAMIDSSTDAIISMTLSAIVTSWNRGAEQVFGYSSEEMIGQPVTRLIPVDRTAEQTGIIERIGRGEIVEHFESIRTRKDGSRINVGLNLCSIRDKSNNITGIAEVVRDITSSKRTEAAIKNIVVGLSSSIGETFFEAITEQLAKTLGADYTFVGELIAEGQSVRTLSVWADGKIVSNFEYNLLHSPCTNVIGKQTCSYPCGVGALFPQDEPLKNMGVEGYVGVPLFGSREQPLGLLVALFRRPIDNTQYTESIVQSFAARTAAEIERMYVEDRMEYLAYHDDLTGLPNRALAFSTA